MVSYRDPLGLLLLYQPPCRVGDGVSQVYGSGGTSICLAREGVGISLEFMEANTSMGLSQVIQGLTSKVKHT